MEKAERTHFHFRRKHQKAQILHEEAEASSPRSGQDLLEEANRTLEEQRGVPRRASTPTPANSTPLRHR